uniref:Uncharacterized protein n=1 Tax=Anguilla anguilla TaxID=7936 RepID=A0A0E9QW67_ANGAN
MLIKSCAFWLSIKWFSSVRIDMDR